MAKKTRSTSTASAAATKSAPTFAGIQRGSATVEFNPDYSTIKKELKQVGVLAGSFLVLLVVLSFFIK
jgi:hypothetical protein